MHKHHIWQRLITYQQVPFYSLHTHTQSPTQLALSMHSEYGGKKHQLETSHFSRCERQYLNFNAHRFQCTSMLRLVLVEYIFCAAGNRITYWYTFPFSQPTKTGFLFSQSERHRMNEKEEMEERTRWSINECVRPLSNTPIHWSNSNRKRY